MTEYRIVEHLGEFTIEGKFDEPVYKGMLWWKKEIYKIPVWKRVSCIGTEPVYIHNGYIPCSPLLLTMPPLKTLEEAKAHIETFSKEPIYHYPKRST